MAQSLAERKHPQALPLARPVPQGVELRAQLLAYGRRNRYKFGGQLVDRVAQTVTEACSREQRPHALRSAVEAIGEHPFDPIGRLLVERRTLEHLIGLGKGGRTGLRRRAQVPDDTATDNRGQIDLVGETATVLLIESREMLGVTSKLG